MEGYRQWLSEKEMRERTIIQYIKTAKTFQQWYLKRIGESNYDPTRISGAELQEWKEYLIHKATYTKEPKSGGRSKQPKRYSMTSVQTFIKEIKIYFEFLTETEIIQRNPAKNIKPPRIQSEYDTAPRWLNRDERSRLLNYINNKGLKDKNSWRSARNKAIILAILYAGLRRSELANLQLEEIISEKSSLHVLKSSNGMSRLVPMSPELKDALEDWLLERGAQQHAYVFSSQENNPLSAQSVWYLCETVGKRIGIKDLTPHVLRHTFAHDLMVKGYSLKSIAVLLGHNNLNYTRVYLRPNKTGKKEGRISTSESDSGT